MFHTEAANSMYVAAEGQALLRDGMVKGKKWYSLTADYAFGHDLLQVAKRFMAANGGEFAADELVPTDVADFSPYLLKIRNAKPDLVISNLAGNQITNFMKQYKEYGLPFPVAGFGFDTAVAWGAGKGNVLGTWPLVWDSQVKTPSSQRFVEAFVEEVRQAAGEPGLGRLSVDQARGAGDERNQEHRFDQGRRAPRKGRQVRHPEDARGLLPRLGSSADAADVHADLQAGGRGQGPMGSVHAVGAGTCRRPEPGSSGADEDREQLHDAGLMRAARRARHAARVAPVTMLIQILEQVLNGLLAGAYYLLIALGLTLIFSLGGLVNLAHGAFYALGAYFAVKIADVFGFGAAFVLSPIAVALIGIVVERFLFRRFYREDPALGLLLTFGLAMVAEQALRWIFGAAPIPFSIPPALKGQLLLGDFIYSKYRLLMLAVAASRGRRTLVICCDARRSAAWSARVCRTPTWSPHSASRWRPTWRAWSRSRSRWRRWPACCSRRSPASIRRWVPRYSPRRSSSWSSAGSVRSGAWCARR